MLRREKDVRQLVADTGVPLLHRRLLDQRHDRRRRVVVENIDSSAAPNGTRDPGLDRGLVGEVSDHEVHIQALGARELHCLRAALLVHVGAEHGRALARERQTGHPALTACRS